MLTYLSQKGWLWNPYLQTLFCLHPRLTEAWNLNSFQEFRKTGEYSLVLSSLAPHVSFSSRSEPWKLTLAWLFQSPISLFFLLHGSSQRQIIDLSLYHCLNHFLSSNFSLSSKIILECFTILLTSVHLIPRARWYWVLNKWGKEMF